jgi:hypothetical protein
MVPFLSKILLFLFQFQCQPSCVCQLLFSIQERTAQAKTSEGRSHTEDHYPSIDADPKHLVGWIVRLSSVLCGDIYQWGPFF